MADIQGSRFHLLAGKQDWGSCRLPGGSTLALSWPPDAGSPPGPGAPLEWDERTRALRLSQRSVLFRRARSGTAPELSARRGADRDPDGATYWIDEEQRGIQWQRPDGDGGTRSTAAQAWWSVDDLADPTGPCAPGAFVPVEQPLPVDATLHGLAVTCRRQVVVGWQGTLDGSGASGGPGRSGLLVFDLRSGGEPLVLGWPDGSGFAPFDLAAIPGGGLLVLDRTARRFWRLDRDLRVPATMAPGPVPDFLPSETSPPPEHLPPRGSVVHTEGIELAGGVLGDTNPVAIEPGPDGAVFVLDSPAGAAASRLLYLPEGGDARVWSLADLVRVGDPVHPEREPEIYPVRGHDLAVRWPGRGPSQVCGCGGAHDKAADGSGGTDAPAVGPVLLVVDHGGKQVIAFQAPPDPGAAGSRLTVLDDYLPMRRFAGRALIMGSTDAWYDFGSRWVPLVRYVECLYAPLGVFTTPTGFDRADAVAGQPFDSASPGCAWHRVFLDATLPPETSVTVRARASDDADLLEATTWVPQPTPYLRGGGAELPWHDPWRDLGVEERARQRVGTWELLLQSVRGRYLELEVTLHGSGRQTPAVRAVRAWFPRFSYLAQYLPEVYREDTVAADLTERFLANPEGVLTALEERMEHVSVLLDPRQAPPEVLEWLASFVGLLLEPQWNEPQRRFLVRRAHTLFERRGTVRGLEQAIGIYLCPDPQDTILDGPSGQTGARVVERFLVRGLENASAENASAENASAASMNAVPVPAVDDPQSWLDPDVLAAHRYDVLVPGNLAAEEVAMLGRILEVEGPAHALAQLGSLGDLFRVGQARLGVDSQLGQEMGWPVMVLDRATLAGTLAAGSPFDISDRVVPGRDRVGEVPAL